ncbi:Uncharacterised protein [Mycobacteroides abscessus]|nr:Uncharacterised protein [Mycobacteroides abscessus]
MRRTTAAPDARQVQGGGAAVRPEPADARLEVPGRQREPVHEDHVGRYGPTLRAVRPVRLRDDGVHPHPVDQVVPLLEGRKDRAPRGAPAPVRSGHDGPRSPTVHRWLDGQHRAVAERWATRVEGEDERRRGARDGTDGRRAPRARTDAV